MRIYSPLSARVAVGVEYDLEGEADLFMISEPSLKSGFPIMPALSTPGQIRKGSLRRELSFGIWGLRPGAATVPALARADCSPAFVRSAANALVLPGIIMFAKTE